MRGGASLARVAAGRSWPDNGPGFRYHWPPMSNSPRIVRTRSLGKNEAMRIRHPLNPEPTEMFIHMISAGAGLERQIVSIVRLPPGKESFLSHAHTFQEEFVFILEGQGEAIFGDETHSVGPGDFVGYPCDGVAHQLRNTSDADLVLSGGRGAHTIRSRPLPRPKEGRRVHQGRRDHVRRIGRPKTVLCGLRREGLDVLSAARRSALAHPALSTF